MFGVDSSELFIILLVAIVVIGPKELPRVMGTIGKWIGRARGMANQFRSGMDQMVRESEIADLEQKWREQNDAIMRANPLGTDSGWGLPVSPPPPVSLEKVSPPSEGAPGAVMLEKSPPTLQPGSSETSPVMPAATASGQQPRRRPIVPALVKPAGAAPRADTQADRA